MAHRARRHVIVISSDDEYEQQPAAKQGRRGGGRKRAGPEDMGTSETQKKQKKAPKPPKEKRDARYVGLHRPLEGGGRAWRGRRRCPATLGVLGRHWLAWCRISHAVLTRMRRWRPTPSQDIQTRMDRALARGAGGAGAAEHAGRGCAGGGSAPI